MGHYELRLNGEKVGDHFMAPGWTHYDEQSLYNTYDVTEQVLSGENCLGMMLGNGFYSIPNTRYRKLITAYGNPNMILMLKLTFKDGSTETIVSNEQWKVAPGPITYSSVFGGENFNATLEHPGWDFPGFDDGSWRNAIQVQSDAELIPEKDYPLKVAEEIEPVSVRRTGNGYLYDFGQNASGIIRISLSGKRGDTVRLIPSELLRDNLEPDQRATGSPYYFLYVLKGEGTETWSPKFTYTGFRYVHVEGAVPDSVNSSKPKISQLDLLHTRNSVPVSGEFTTSLDLFNRINSLILWAIRSNIASVVTDCPHREKLGWLEQTYLMGGSIHYNFDIYHLYCKMIEDMIVAQDVDGLVPCIAPEYTEFTGGFRDTPEWGSASVILPWLMYRWYGDTYQMEKAWDMMNRYMKYLESKSENNILSHGLGDWFDLGPESPGLAQLTPVALTATAIYYHDLVLMAEIAELLDKTVEAEFYSDKAEIVREAFNKKYYDPHTGTYSTGSQTAMAMPLVLGIVDEEYRELVLDNLIDSIHASKNALTAGDVGFHFLVKALQDGGAGEVLFEMNARDDVPGYGYQLKNGATTLTESWSALKGKSNNHLMLGHLMEWFYAGLAGIDQTEESLAYREILISPQIVGDISSASASFESPYGNIVSKWKKSGSNLDMEINIPVNAAAKVVFPVKGEYSILEGDIPLENREGFSVLSYDEKGCTLRIGSGNYRFLITEQ